MKRKITSAILAAFIAVSAATSVHVSADTGIFNIKDNGDYKIFYTKRSGMVAPHVGNFYIYSGCGVLDSEGKLLVYPIYHKINDLKCERSLYRIYDSNQDKYGFFDENWVVMDGAVFDEARDFSENVAVVGMRIGAPSPIATTMRYGVIDKDGNIVVPMEYHYISDAENGKIEVHLEEQTYPMTESKPRIGYYSTDGTLLEQPYFRHDNSTKEVITYLNSVSFGDIRVKNTELEYPIVSINDYNRYGSFLPLTYDNCKMLGLGISWSEKDGLAIWKNGAVPEKCGLGESALSKNGKTVMSVYNGDITINGKKYTNKDAPIPMLYHNDIVYLPLYWSHAMYELGLAYSYSLEREMEIITNRPDIP